MKAVNIVASIAVVAIVVLSAVAVLSLLPEPRSAEDIGIYTDIGIEAAVENRDGNTVCLKATASDGTEFGGWYDASGKLLSDSPEYAARIYTDTVYAYAKSYTVTEVGTSVDLADAMSVDGSGTLTVSVSDYDGTEASVDGTTVTFESSGVYTVTYTGEDAKRCARILADETVENTFGWQYFAEDPQSDLETSSGPNANTFSVTLEIKYSDYRHYQDIYKGDRCSYYLNKNKDDASLAHDVSYVDYDGVQDVYISQIAKHISDTAGPVGAQTMANIILAFTQYIHYSADIDIHGEEEYFQFPLETLFLNSGDCEDTTILFCAVANYMGYDTSLLLFEGHMGAGIELAEYKPLRRAIYNSDPAVRGWSTDVHGSEKYYYFGETTTTGWLIGEVPSDISRSYIGMMPVPGKTVKAVIPEMILTGGVHTSAEDIGYGFVRLTASVEDGSEFLGWFDSEGVLLSSSEILETRFSEGDVVYAVADAYLNEDSSIRSGEPVLLSAIGENGTLTFITGGVSEADETIVFDDSGRYLVSYPRDGETTYGVIYVYADVTLYVSPGLSAESSGGHLCTVVTVTADLGTPFDGIYDSNGELVSRETAWRGDVRSGTAFFAFSDKFDCIGSMGTEIDLPSETGLSEDGTWAYATREVFDGILRLDAEGYCIVTYTDGNSEHCFRILSTLAGHHMSYDISGWEEAGLFDVAVRGTMTTSYLEYDPGRDAYQMRQTYSFSDGRTGDRTYWSDENDIGDIESRHAGTYVITTANYGYKNCVVYEVTYTSQAGLTVTEEQYFDQYDGVTLYKIVVNQYRGPFLVSHSVYDLSDCSYLERSDIRALT